MFKVIYKKGNGVLFTFHATSNKIFSSFSGYGKGGPCPSKDTWLLTIDKGDWERLGECPTTKTSAAMVTVPPYSACAAIGQNAAEQSANMAFGTEPSIAVLWGGREKNPSSIRVSVSLLSFLFQLHPIPSFF